MRTMWSTSFRGSCTPTDGATPDRLDAAGLLGKLISLGDGIGLQPGIYLAGMSTRVVVVSVYDAATGWSTRPVAAVGWRTGWTWWDWVPLSEPARHLRYDVLGELDDAEREAWLQQHFDEPSVTYSVTESHLVEGADADVRRAVQNMLDALLVAGA